MMAGTRRRLAGRVVGLGVAALGLVAVGPTAPLVVVGETRRGRLFGGVAAGTFAAMACSAVLLLRPPARTWPWWAAAGLSTAAAGLAVALARGAPPASPERSAGLLSRSIGPARVPWVGRARTIREVTMGLYREIEADPGARGLEPVTHFAALELVGASFDAGHYFAYVPEPRAGERPGVVVFLHGNGGNFQVVPWAWRAFAEKERVAILCPSFGFGFWGEGGSEAADRAWLDFSGRWPVDPDRVYLAGLSDGGVGVTRSGAAHPGRYRGLIYISPTMRLDELARPEYTRGWEARPILVLQGDRDWSVAKGTVDPAVDLLRRRGARVDYRVFAGEDHFLFFSRRAELFEIIGGWMAEVGPGPATREAGEP